MKFVKNATLAQRAEELHQMELRMAKLRRIMKRVAAEHNGLAQFLQSKVGEDFQFAGADGYLKELDFVDSGRQVMDQDKVRAIFQKMGKKVPMKASQSRMLAKVSYVTEEVEAGEEDEAA